MNVRFRKGRTTTLFAGLGLAGIVTVTLTFWKDFVAQYHLHRLRKEPEYFAEILEVPEGSAERKALRAFLKRHDAKEKLFRIHVNPALALLIPDLRKRGVDIPATVKKGVLWLDEDRLSYVQRASEIDFATHGLRLRDVPRSRLKAVDELLSELEGAEFTLPDYTGLKFTILSAVDAPAGFPGIANRAAGKYICLIQRD